MFEVVTGAKAGQLLPATRAAAIRADCRILRDGAKQIVAVLPEMAAHERAQMRLAFAEAIQRMNEYEEIFESVKRITDAREPATVG